MSTLSFTYRKPDGEEKAVTLANWRESGKYLEGMCLEHHAPRTYRKDRVACYHDGAESQLDDPFPLPPPPVVRAPEILFTGFPAATRSELEQFAVQSGMKVVKSATQNLAYLCGGPNAGPSKVDKARKNGAWILDRVSLYALVETGELPEESAPDAVTVEVNSQ